MNRIKHFSRLLYAAVAALALVVPAALAPTIAVGQQATQTAPPSLVLTNRHREVAVAIAGLAQLYHFGRITFNDSVSSNVFDRYINHLDGQKLFFLASEIASFEPLRMQMDDRIRNAQMAGQLDPLIDIFWQYRDRHVALLRYAIGLVEGDLNLTSAETYVFDRSELPWPATPEERNATWRQRVTHEAIGLLLGGATWDDAKITLRTRYERIIENLEELDIDAAFESLMNAYTLTLDPHTNYLSPRTAEEAAIQMAGIYEGIGAELTADGQWTLINKVFDGGPAHVDGRLKPQDRIVGVGQGTEGEIVDVIGWRLNDVVQLIRGAGGTVVRLQVLPVGVPAGGQTVIIELTRAEIRIEGQQASSEIVEIQRNGQTVRVGVITIPSFYQDTASRAAGNTTYASTTLDVFNLLLDLEDANVAGIVIDLRGNGGGLLEEAQTLSGLFLPRGPVVQLRDFSGQNRVSTGIINGPVYTGPLAVLVDRYSASASEIFAGVIQDYQRGVIIGQPTYGKGTVQYIFNMTQYVTGNADAGQLTMTTGKFYRVTGASTQHRGVVPDIVFPSDIDPEIVGESSRDGALPWDQTNATAFAPTGAISASALAVLRNYHQARSATDPDYQYLTAEVAARQAEFARTTIPLSLEARRVLEDAYEQAALARENARRTALGLSLLIDVAGLADLAPLDVQKTQAAHIVADLASVLQMTRAQIDAAAAALTATSNNP